MSKLHFFALLAGILLVFLPTARSDVCRKYNCASYNSAAGYFCLNESVSTSRAYTVDAYEGMCSSLVSSANPQCVYSQVTNATVSRNVVIGTCQPNNMSSSSYSWKPRYPGEWCDTLGAKFQCITGYRRCQHNRCMGYVKGELCSMHADCDPGLWCNSGMCDYVLNASTPCTESAACGRDMYCLTTNWVTLTKQCVSYFSVPDGTRVVPQDGKTVMQDQHHWLCASGSGYDKNLTSTRYGVCGSPLFSNKSGQGCDSTMPCTTNGTTANAYDVATCTCSYGVDGANICGIERANTEWVEATAKFKTYIAATKDCHVARSFYDECDVPVIYNTFMCSYSKAKYYHANKNPASCLLNMANPWLFPELANTKAYCNYKASGTILQQGFMAIFLFLTAFLAISQ